MQKNTRSSEKQHYALRFIDIKEIGDIKYLSNDAIYYRIRNIDFQEHFLHTIPRTWTRTHSDKSKRSVLYIPHSNHLDTQNIPFQIHFLSYNIWNSKQGLITNMLTKAMNLTFHEKMQQAIDQWFIILLINEYPDWLLANVAYWFIDDQILDLPLTRKAKSCLGAYSVKHRVNKSSPDNLYKRKLNLAIANISKTTGPSSAKKIKTKDIYLIPHG